MASHSRLAAIGKADVPSHGAGSAANGIPSTVERLLEGLERGDPAALDALVAVRYEELRVVAHRQRRRRRGDDTLGTTALPHETYLKLRQQKRIGTDSRDQFLALASRAMRHILSTYAEQRRTLKRGGAVGEQVDLSKLPAAENSHADDLLRSAAWKHRIPAVRAARRRRSAFNAPTDNPYEPPCSCSCRE